MKPPQLKKKEILAGLKNAHARFSGVHAKAKAARESVSRLQTNTPEWSAAWEKAHAAEAELQNELWRFVGAVEFHIGVRP